MNISKVARLTGLSAKTLRYYEAIGLIPAPHRGENGYREYDDHSLRRIRFVKNARDAGFSLDECRELLALSENACRTSAEVKALTLARITDIEQRIAHLQAMLQGLQRLADQCHGDGKRECPIMDALAGGHLSASVKE
ncbi:Cu(I)-responsive transcriptional regulator [Oceanimonas doudoroffii]|uniref:Cu(I)-responsive transcriptional regulator n=1 Tax=Oceanimonas doudoroffii TaxID=84158 RepID=A0A233REA1_9GAMM|nr:Cu(I)-responsive transcriptional regulator [Oceanimonas doudoroffii]OXY81702.1 Cu(I)-responsive transcriptional regulator [Oceanimonas doudoroffii]